MTELESKINSLLIKLLDRIREATANKDYMHIDHITHLKYQSEEDYDSVIRFFGKSFYLDFSEDGRIKLFCCVNRSYGTHIENEEIIDKIRQLFRGVRQFEQKHKEYKLIKFLDENDELLNILSTIDSDDV